MSLTRISFENILIQESHGISPIFHSSYPPLFLHLAHSGADISLLLAGEVYDRLKNEYKDTLDEFLRIPTTRLYVSREQIKLASVVTDNYFNMSLFSGMEITILSGTSLALILLPINGGRKCSIIS